MDNQLLKFITKKPLLHDFVTSKPCCKDAEFTMPSNYVFKEKLVTIMLHSHAIIAFARNHNNHLLIDFLNFNNLKWEKHLFISIDIIAKKFVAFLGEETIIYFVILDPTTTIVKFDEKSWTYEIINIFDNISKGSFINDQYIYILREKSAYCINLHSIEDEEDFICIQGINQNSKEKKDLSNAETGLANNDEINPKHFYSPNNENKKRIKIDKYIFKEDYFDQKEIFATQQFSRYNLIYTGDDELPLLIFDQCTNSFCFKNELLEKKDYFRRKISSIYPLNEARFMQVPGKNNGFFLFHDFESFQNSVIPIREPLVIQDCKNEDNEPLVIITVSVRRISPIIGMFSLPGESFNFFSVSSNHYYQFYTSCGLLSFIDHSKNIINSKQKTGIKQELKNFKLDIPNKKVENDSNLEDIEKNPENLSLPSLIPTPENKLLTNKFQINAKIYENLNNQNLQQNEELTAKNVPIEEKKQISLPIKLALPNNDQKKQSKVQMVMHYLCLGPIEKVNLPFIEFNIEPDYHMIITTPNIPHCYFMKNIEVIVTSDSNDDVLSFFLKPSMCVTPQKIKVKCNPESKYLIKIRVSNGYQNTFSDTIEIITPNPGIPPKVEDFFGTYISDDIYLFKWTSVPDLYAVKYYILEGCKENTTETKFSLNNDDNNNDFEMNELEIRIHDNINEYIMGELPNQHLSNSTSGDNFEYIVELANDVANNNICGAKLKITTQYKQFRIRASNTIGISEPSEPCRINKKINDAPQKGNKKASVRITKEQVNYLSEYYNSNPYPNFNERNKIAELLSLSYQTVNSWFARKRHLDKINSQQSSDTKTQKENDIQLNLYEQL